MLKILQILFFVFMYSSLFFAQQDSLQMRFQEAVNLYEQAKYREAYAIWEELKEKMPENPEISYYMGRCVYNMLEKESFTEDKTAFSANIQKAFYYQQIADSIYRVLHGLMGDGNVNVNMSVYALRKDLLHHESRAHEYFNAAYISQYDYLIKKDPKEKKNKKTNVVVWQQLYNEFNTDKYNYYNDNTIPVNQVVPDGLVYRIQLGVYSAPKAYNVFKGLYPLYIERQENSDKSKYLVGLFSRYADASSALTQVKQMGFNDAFIICTNNGMEITPGKALLIEKSVKINK